MLWSHQQQVGTPFLSTLRVSPLKKTVTLTVQRNQVNGVGCYAVAFCYPEPSLVPTYEPVDWQHFPSKVKSLIPVCTQRPKCLSSPLYEVKRNLFTATFKKGLLFGLKMCQFTTKISSKSFHGMFQTSQTLGESRMIFIWEPNFISLFFPK